MAFDADDDGNRLNAVDVLHIAVIFVLAALATLFRRQLGEMAFWLLAVFASLLAFVVVSALLASRRVLWRVMHDFSAALMLPVLFNTLELLIDCANPQRWDPTFAELDERWFGALPVLWRGVLDRPAWFTDLAYVAYLGYYVTPVVLAAVLYRRSEADFRRMVFTVVLTFYASYAGYFMFPTLGPRVLPGAESLVIGGGGIAHAARLFISVAERTQTDAFPSGHAAVGLVCLYFAWQLSGMTFGLFVPVVAGIIFSTVYLHYHYVVDVVAGVGLAWGCGWLGLRLQPAMEPREVRRWFAVRLNLR